MNTGEAVRSPWARTGEAFAKGAVELLFYLPILLLAAVYLLPGSGGTWWLVTLFVPYGAAALILGFRLSIRVAVRLAVSAALGLGHVALVMLLTGQSLSAGIWFICALPGAAMAERGFAQRRSDWSRSFQTGHMLSGLAAYIAIQPLKLLALRALEPYSLPLTVCGFAAVIVCFLLINERHLTSELIDTGKTPSALASRRRNRVMMAALIGVMLFIALFRQIQEWVEQWLKRMLQTILSWFSSEEEPPPPEVPQEAPPQSMFPPSEEQEPSAFMELVEQIVMYVVYAALAVAAAVLLLLAVKKLYGLLQKLLSRLLQRQSAAANDSGAYHDEIENLMSLTKWRKKMGGRLKGLYRKAGKGEAGWSQLATNRDKARYLYKLMVRQEIERGYTPQPHLTPRETAKELADRKDGKRQEAHSGNGRAFQHGKLSSGAGDASANPTDLVNMYERARYGGAEPRSEDVERYRKWLEGRTKKS